jgi:hypothetical protein
MIFRGSIDCEYPPIGVVPLGPLRVSRQQPRSIAGIETHKDLGSGGPTGYLTTNDNRFPYPRYFPIP